MLYLLHQVLLQCIFRTYHFLYRGATALLVGLSVLATNVEESDRASNGCRRHDKSACIRVHYQGEFQHNYFDFVSLHHSDHDGVVRIFVGSTRHNFSLSGV